MFLRQPAAGVVLLVEDDDSVAGVTTAMLERCVPRVLRAANGAEAERLLLAHRDEIVLAMVDCWLPDTMGPALCQRFRGVVPSLPVLLTSGCDNVDAKQLASGGRAAFLPKPFYPAQVMREVTALLGPDQRPAV